MGLYQDFAQRVLHEAQARAAAEEQEAVARRAQQGRLLEETHRWVTGDILPVLHEAAEAYRAIGAPVAIEEAAPAGERPMSVSFILGEIQPAARGSKRDRRVIVDILPVDTETVRILSRSATGRVLDQSYTRATVSEGLQTHLFAALEDWVRLAPLS